jgi:hypothetical protein
MLPNFIIIGAQKSGTTWLYKNLELHPEIWLPPEKELHFFDLPPAMPMYGLLFAPLKAARAWTWNRMVRDWGKVSSGEGSAWWYWKYYFLPRCWWWYESLFSPKAGQICGEATPRYATLKERQIQKITARLPQLKIIYLLRNPVDRMWSDVAMFHSRRFGGNGLSSSDRDSVVRFLNDPEHLAHSKYVENLARWEKHLPGKQIFVGFYDDISKNPESLLKQIFEFLAVDPSFEPPGDLLKRRINKNDYPPMPEGIREMLSMHLLGDLEMLSKKTQNEWVNEWLNSARTSDKASL